MRMTCEEAAARLVDVLLGDAERRDVRALDRHLRSCSRCWSAGAALRTALDRLAIAVDDVTPPAALRSRVLARVHAEFTDAMAMKPRRRPPRWRRVWAHVPATRAVTMACLLAAVAATAVAIELAERPPSRQAQPSVITSCEIVGNPRVCGSLNYDAGAGVAALTVRGLEPPATLAGAATTSYEVWMVRADGTPIDVGFLTSAPDGHALTAVIGGDLARVLSVDVTREPPDGSQFPSGPDVFHLPLRPWTS